MNNLRVLHLFDSYLPQTENWVYNLITSLPGCEIHIGAKKYLKTNFYYPSFCYINNPVGAIESHYNYLNKQYPLDLFKKLLIKSLPFFLDDPLSNMIKYTKTHKIDIVHAHFGKVAWHFRKIPKKLKLPFVVSFYGYDYEKVPFLQPVFQKRYQQLFLEADYFLCEGQNGAKILERKGCPPEKIKVVHIGVPVEKIPFYERFKKKGNLKLLQIASFTSKKGYFQTVEAFETALETCPKLSLTLLGDAREEGLKSKIKRQIQEKGLNHKIKVLDSIDYTQLYPFLKDFDVFIHPSHYTENMDCEGGAPIILLDAQATGMPIISTNHCDIPEEVIHGKTGLLTEEKNINGLINAIRQFYQMDQQAFNEFAENARNHVLENYAVTKTSAGLRAIYDEILYPNQ